MATSEKLKDWGYHVAIGFDQLFNAILGGAADETLSSRTYRGAVLETLPKRKWQVMHRIIETLFFWENGQHCKTAYQNELNRKQYPKAFRRKN